MPTPPPATEPPPWEPDLPTDVDPMQTYAEALLGAHTRAVADALQALLDAGTALAQAQAAAEEATREADRAREADDRARQALQLARAAERRTQRELAQTMQRISDTRDELGAIARNAYRTGGTMVSLSVFLETETPAQFADTYTGMRTLLRAGDTALSDLAEGRAELVNTQHELRGLRVDRQRLAGDAADRLAAKEAAELDARDAQDELDAHLLAQTEAYQAAQEARAEDFARYQHFLAESDALESYISAHELTGTGNGTGSFVRPGTGPVTSTYGSRLHPILGYVKIHTGIDLGRGDGLIYAADDGVVVEAGWNDAYGYLVVVDHGIVDGRHLSTLYAHQPGLQVEPGQPVAKGDPIGLIGSTGYSTGPHLHFEVRVDGQPADPWPWIVDAPLP